MDNLEQKIDAPKTGEGNQPSDNITLSKAEYEKMQSELNEAKTKLTSSTKESQKLHAISECARNDKYFAKVYRSDKRIANEVAKHFGYADAEALDKKLKEQHGDDYAPNVDPEEIKKSTKDEVQSEFAKSDLQHFIKEKGLKE
ncbi:MAG: hypothetical protein LBG59_07525 [Candidatus Peribacteria bacterium]|jgi:hypothetical protein|nr:hypothetical protein [Candidatus Peribacteria bacterium]